MSIFFVEHTKNDKYWADGLDGKGTNYLGKLLTTLAYELKCYIDEKTKEKAEEKEPKKMKIEVGDVKKLGLDVETYEWKVDTLSKEYKEWIGIPNWKIIKDGKQFYKEQMDIEKA